MAYDAGVLPGSPQGQEAVAGGGGYGAATSGGAGRGSVAAGAPVHLRFTGGALPMFGRTLLALICTVLIIPAAWGVVPYIRWFVEQLEWSDGTRARFEGKPSEIWPLLSLAGLIGFLPLGITQAFGDVFLVTLGGNILMAGISAVIAVPIWKYYVRKTRIGPVNDLTFDGDAPTYAAFNIGVQLAAYTVVGWAWVAAALQRWLMGHIHSRDVRFEFHGSGLSILWRTIVFALTVIFIIPIPWTARWLVAWFVEQTVMYRTDGLQPPAV